jgi:hypothetical protein
VAASNVTLNYNSAITVTPNAPKDLLAVSGSGPVRLKYRSTGQYLKVQMNGGVVNPDTWVNVNPNEKLSVVAVGVPYGVYKETVTVDAELP